MLKIMVISQPLILVSHQEKLKEFFINEFFGGPQNNYFYATTLVTVGWVKRQLLYDFMKVSCSAFGEDSDICARPYIDSEKSPEFRDLAQKHGTGCGTHHLPYQKDLLRRAMNTNTKILVCCENEEVLDKVEEILYDKKFSLQGKATFNDHVFLLEEQALSQMEPIQQLNKKIPVKA